MNVLKFGGTSVGSVERMKHVANLILKDKGNIVVLSAMSGTTNQLDEICQYLSKGNQPGALEIINALRAKYDAVILDLLGRDNRYAEEAVVAVSQILALLRTLTAHDFTQVEAKEILAQGELISTNIFHQYLKSLGVKSALLPALEFMRIDARCEPDMRFITSRLERLLEVYDDAEVYLTQGYICRNHDGMIDNLRRGGSDYTASLIGAAVQAGEIQIWTDIDGMHNNDPRYVENTSPVSSLHFEEAAELAYFGAKILHPACVLPARIANIPVRLLNTLEPDRPGTLIYDTPPSGTIKAVAAKDNITAIKIKSGRTLLAYGFLSKVFETFARYHTSIDMIATSEVGVTVTIDDTSHLADIVDDLRCFGSVTVDPDMVIICVVGDLEWHNSGFEARAVTALGDIPVRMISYGGSNHNISMLVSAADKVKALRYLSQHLF